MSIMVLSGAIMLGAVLCSDKDTRQEQLEPAEVNRFVGVLNEAYAEPAPFSLWTSEFAHTLIDESELSGVPVEERPEVITPTATGVPMTKINEWEHVCDGTDGLVVKRRVVTLGGPLSLKPTRVFSSVHIVNLDAGMPDELTLGRFEYGTDNLILERLATGRMTHEEDRARTTDSFIYLARWAGRMLLIAKDCKGSRVDDDTVEVHSDAMRMRAWFHPTTGELQRIQFPKATGDTYTWWWEGVMDGVRFPARHPKWQYHQTADTTGKTFQGSVLRFERLVPVQVQPDQFDWRTYRPFAFDVTAGRVINHDGHVDEQRTERRKSLHPPRGRDIKVEVNPAPKKNGSGK